MAIGGGGIPAPCCVEVVGVERGTPVAMTPTSDEPVRDGASSRPHEPPRHILAVSAYLTDRAGRVLLVRTNLRHDTWELPGGQVEQDEDPLAALVREVREETGIEATVTALVAVDYNLRRGICCLVFRGTVAGGAPRPSPETPDVRFVPADDVETWVTRPQFRTRIERARRGEGIPYRTFTLEPFRVVRALP